MILANTLSRAYQLVPAETNLFTEQLATLAENQMSELRMIASTTTLNIIKDAVATEDQYVRLRTQIAVGWPDRSNDLTSDLRQFRMFADELTMCDDHILKGTRLVIPRGVKRAKQCSSAYTSRRLEPTGVFIELEKSSSTRKCLPTLKRLFKDAKYVENTMKQTKKRHYSPTPYPRDLGRKKASIYPCSVTRII